MIEGHAQSFLPFSSSLFLSYMPPPHFFLSSCVSFCLYCVSATPDHRTAAVTQWLFFPFLYLTKMWLNPFIQMLKCSNAPVCNHVLFFCCKQCCIFTANTTCSVFSHHLCISVNGIETFMDRLFVCICMVSIHILFKAIDLDSNCLFTWNNVIYHYTN